MKPSVPPDKLGVYSLSMIVIGLVIGMGIFRAASVSAGAAIHPYIFFAAWIFGGVVALCGALTYAEIGSRFPVTGAYYRIFSEAYHPAVAFSINGIILVSNAASLGGVALIGSDYLSEIVFDVPPTDLLKALIAISAIAAFYGVNLLGLRMSSNTLNVLMLVKIAMILVIIAALLNPNLHAPQVEWPSVLTGFGWKEIAFSFGATLIAVSFTYGGYQQVINFGDDVHHPSKTLPKSIGIGIAVILGLYLLVNWSYFRVIGFEDLKTAKGIAALVAEKMMGPAGKQAFALLLFLAVLAYVNVSLMSNPRVMCAMSEDGILPNVFRYKSANRSVLTISLTAFTLICVIVVFFAETFDSILGFVMILDSLGMATSAATIFYFRRKAAAVDGYTIRFYPWMPLLFIAAYGFIGAMSFYLNPIFGWTAVAVFIALFGLYFVIVRKPLNTDVSENHSEFPAPGKP